VQHKRKNCGFKEHNQTQKFMYQKQKNSFRLSFRFIAAVLVAGFCLIAFSCSDDKKSDPAPTKNIVALAQGTPSLSTLAALLAKYPNLVTLLSGTTKYTVFAPTNDAFTAFLAAIGQTVDNIPVDVLEKALQYHVVAGEVKSTALTTSNVATAVGENIAVNVSSGVVLNGATKVTTADVSASNGVVHIIDKVLIQPTVLPVVGTIYAPAFFNKDFSTLVAAVNGASQATRDLLLNSSKKTLFAPDNAAFAAAGFSSATALPSTPAAIDAILAYHVLGSEVRAAGLPNVAAPGNSAITTLGGTFYLSNRSDGVFINGRTQITKTDISASNGVVHLINRTLVPPSQTIKDIAIALSTAATGAEFKSLVAALSKLAAADILAAAGNASSNLTLFAPTDAAFAASGIDLATVPDATLVAVLQKHLITIIPNIAPTGRVFSRDLVSGAVPTLNGNVTIDAAAATVTSGGVTAKIATTTPALINVLGTNGVIHTIDKVLLP
jgi:transforming growth factor-beta-induced protein